MTGLLAQTNAYIRDAERQHRDQKARENQVRRPIQLIDRLLQELEELNLKGMKRVPTSYEPRLDEILGLVRPIGSMPDQLANIKVKVWINAYRVVAPHVPFGGFGASGIGRENGVDAIREYTETKSVWVELTGATRDPFTLG